MVWKCQTFKNNNSLSNSKAGAHRESPAFLHLGSTINIHKKIVRPYDEVTNSCWSPSSLMPKVVFISSDTPALLARFNR